MSRQLDLKGQPFGRLTALRLVGIKITPKGKQTVWLCVCSCGETKTFTVGQLRSGNAQSCGCLHRDLMTSHGLSRSIEYRAWASMLQRCTNSRSTNYHRYGGRGIRVCKRWLKFENFYKDMGPRPSLRHSIERKKNNKGYGPSNCKWATRIQQANNTRRNVYVVIDGRIQTIAEWTAEAGLNRNTIQKRLKRGWSGAQLLTASTR